jgi:G3E family GTPase
MQAEVYRQVSFSGRPWQPMPTQSPTRHDDAIRSFSINFPDPVVWQNLVDALEMLAVLHGNQLLRVKGIVNIAGEAQPRAIHIVQHTLYPAARLPGWPDADHRTRLVFIVRGLDEVRVRDTLAAFVDKPAARATGSASVTP